MNMIEVKTADLEGEALCWAYHKATGQKREESVQRLSGFARFIIHSKLGDVVSVPAELINGGGL